MGNGERVSALYAARRTLRGMAKRIVSLDSEIRLLIEEADAVDAQLRDAPDGSWHPLLYTEEKRLLVEALEDAGGSKPVASRILGVAPKTLYRMIDRYGLRAKYINGRARR